MDIGSGLASLNMQANLQRSSEDRMVGGLGSRVPTDAAKIEKGSKEFEAVLVGSWLQQAEKSFATVPGADEDADPGGEQMMSLGVQSLSTSMASTGALGIGKMIAKAMYANAAKADATSGANDQETKEPAATK